MGVRPYIMSQEERNSEKEIKCMLELNVKKEGESNLNSPMMLVEALGKDPLPCIDYRKLNVITIADFSTSKYRTKSRESGSS